MNTKLTLKIDLHNHTTASHDAVITEKDLVAGYHAGKFDVIAITDHGSIEKAQELQQKNLFPMIVGEEITSHEGDVIGLFLKETIPFHLSAQETIRRIKKQGGLVYIPHPFDAPLRFGLRKSTLLSLLPQIDFFETHNGTYFEWLFGVKRKDLVEFAHEHHLTLGAGSDSHIPTDLGKCYLTLHLTLQGSSSNILNDPQTFLKICQKATPTINPHSSLRIILERLTTPKYLFKFLRNENFELVKNIYTVLKSKLFRDS